MNIRKWWLRLGCEHEHPKGAAKNAQEMQVYLDSLSVAEVMGIMMVVCAIGIAEPFQMIDLTGEPCLKCGWFDKNGPKNDEERERLTYQNGQSMRNHLAAR